MSLSFFSVVLNGADADGEFEISFRVAAQDEAEAVTLARASAALKSITITGHRSAREETDELTVKDDSRRVIGHGEKRYLS